ncbi:MAG: flagellar M-ring protein FliF [Myxococcota bacterium]|nr:flagellar M-ring protein FliF [Myxococcota bacterium]
MNRLVLSSLAVLWLAGCSTQIQHGLDERAANELQTVLLERGFEPRKVLEPGKKPTWAIEVDEDRAPDAVRVLSELGLPRPAAQGFSELFGKGSLVPTPTEERALYIQALSGELARTLEGVEGVTGARVHLVVPASPRPGAPAVASKAAAYLRVRAGRAAELNGMREQLAGLIAGSVEGLSPDSVSLVIDEVTATVVATPAQAPPNQRVRVLLATFGGAVVLLAATAILLALRLRSARPPELLPVPAPRPSVSTAARKVA